MSGAILGGNLNNVFEFQIKFMGLHALGPSTGFSVVLGCRGDDRGRGLQSTAVDDVRQAVVAVTDEDNSRWQPTRNRSVVVGTCRGGGGRGDSRRGDEFRGWLAAGTRSTGADRGRGRLVHVTGRAEQRRLAMGQRLTRRPVGGNAVGRRTRRPTGARATSALGSHEGSSAGRRARGHARAVLATCLRCEVRSLRGCTQLKARATRGYVRSRFGGKFKQCV